MNTGGRLRMLEVSMGVSLSLAIFFFGGVYPWVFLPLCAFLFLLTAVYSEGFTDHPFPSRLKTILFLLFVFIFYQRFFSSLSPHSTEIEFLKWAAFLAVIFLAQALPVSSVSRLLAALAILGVLETVYAFYEVHSGMEKVLWQAKEAHRGYLTGTYFNRNHLAGFLELSLGAALGLSVEGFLKRHFPAVFAWGVCFFVLAGGLFLTGSRMGLFSFIGAILVFFPFLIKSAGKNSRPVLIFFILLMAAAFLAGLPVLSERLAAFNGINWDGGRVLVWRSAGRMFHDYRWTGTGLGAFPWVFPAYQPAKLMMGWPHAHQDYLELFSALGVLGFSLLMSAFLYFVRFFILKIKNSAVFPGPLVWGGLISIFSFLIHGFADFNFAIPANAFAFMLTAACCLRLARGEDPHA